MDIPLPTISFSEIVAKIKTGLPAVRQSTAPGQPAGETVIYQREMAVYHALRVLIPADQPGILGGKYSWLEAPDTGHPLQIDIFFPRIARLAGVDLNTPRALAVEVQSTLHDGRWNKSKRAFFNSKEDFERYTAHQEWKREQIMARKIPFLEIDPSTDDLSPAAMRRRLGHLFGLLL